MGALKELAIETEELFTANDFWAEWVKIEDHGLTMYAFCGSRWSWTGDLHKENTHPTVTEPYYLGGEGVRGSSPIFCLDCAIDFSMATGLEETKEGTFTNPEDPDLVYVTKHKVSKNVTESVMVCPCGNALFSFCDVETILTATKNEQISLGQAVDLIYLKGYYEAKLFEADPEFCDPLFKMESED